MSTSNGGCGEPALVVCWRCSNLHKTSTSVHCAPSPCTAPTCTDIQLRVHQHSLQISPKLTSKPRNRGCLGPWTKCSTMQRGTLSPEPAWWKSMVHSGEQDSHQVELVQVLKPIVAGSRRQHPLQLSRLPYFLLSGNLSFRRDVRTCTMAWVSREVSEGHAQGQVEFIKNGEILRSKRRLLPLIFGATFSGNGEMADNESCCNIRFGAVSGGSTPQLT
mmetsp:Transcript_14151/g.33421  ORF Transcript_14151/g.33421 Transcript_14151/m.33421 type:complete len:218 (+) Transcript_14151:374-1027(+)